MGKTDYNRISKKSAKDIEITDMVEEVVETDVFETPEVEAPAEPVLGIVSDCTKLNIRKEADVESSVLFIIGKDSDVLVDLDESTDEWYKVYVNDQEGFCMKDYITLVQ